MYSKRIRVSQHFEIQRDHQELLHFIRSQKRKAALEPFNGGIRGVWQPLFDNDQLVCPLIMMPGANNCESIRPIDMIATFRAMCAKGSWLQLYNAACDMMVSDYQGDRSSDIIKCNVIFAKFLVTANGACEELCERIKTVTTPRYWWAHRTTGLDITHTRGQQHASQRANKKPDQEFQISGHEINSLQKQDAINPVAASWAATCPFGAAIEITAIARGASTVMCAIPT